MSRWLFADLENSSEPARQLTFDLSFCQNLFHNSVHPINPCLSPNQELPLRNSFLSARHCRPFAKLRPIARPAIFGNVGPKPFSAKELVAPKYSWSASSQAMKKISPVSLSSAPQDDCSMTHLLKPALTAGKHISLTSSSISNGNRAGNGASIRNRTRAKLRPAVHGSRLKLPWLSRR